MIATPPPMTQHDEEFAELLELYRRHQPHRVLEIGVEYGGTLYHWYHTAPPGATVVAIDDLHRERDAYENWIGPAALVVIQGDSTDPTTHERAKAHGPYDWVFIDGNHRAEYVRSDWLSYGEALTTPGAIVAFHDTNIDRDPNGLPVEVRPLWEELVASRYHTEEIRRADGYGIGVVHMPPFLTAYTPTYRRPKMLANCEASVANQTEKVQHLIVRDEVGIGIPGMFADIQNHTDQVEGEYVLVLPDDNLLMDEGFAAGLRQHTQEAGDPPVVVFKIDLIHNTFPDRWQQEPALNHIDLACFAVRRDVWIRHATAWGKRYEGDFDFIHYLWQAGYQFSWWDHLGVRATQIGYGKPEPGA